MAPVTLQNLEADAGINLKSQWSNPNDVFSVLLILGGEIVGRALAQLSGAGIAPVAFSFGWVGYSVSALVLGLGENKLLPPEPDYKCKVLNGRTGHAIENSSWIIGRIVRDFPNGWRNNATHGKLNEVLDQRWKELKMTTPTAERPNRAGLIVTVYRPDRKLKAGIPCRDWIYWSGYLTMALQLGVSGIAIGTKGNWSIMVVTVSGTLLAIGMGLLPQWGREKWACRRNSNDSYVITKGNGAQHAIAILANGHGLNLEDLAGGQHFATAFSNNTTCAALFMFTILWILLLITACGIKTETWFLLAIGGIGMLQNVLVAGCNRQPQAFGIPLEFVAVFGCTKVMQTLFEVERVFPRVGRSMCGEFFPSGLSEKEKSMWEEFEAIARSKES